MKPSSSPPTIFPVDYDNHDNDSLIYDDQCPCCKLPLSKHSSAQIVQCALNELGG